MNVSPIAALGLALGAAALVLAPATEAGLVTEIESNDTLATAQNIDGSFTLDFSADIGNAAGANTSTSMPHVTIQGTGGAEALVAANAYPQDIL